MRGQANVLRRWKVKRAGEIKNIYLKVTVPVEKGAIQRQIILFGHHRKREEELQMPKE